MTNPSLYAVCLCKCNDIVTGWTQELYMKIDIDGKPSWFDMNDERFPCTVTYWEYK